MSSAVPTKKLPKPQMRNLLTNQSKVVFGAGLVLAASVALAYKLIVGEGRKRKYAEFYKTYDAEKELKRMVEAGVLVSGKLDS